MTDDSLWAIDLARLDPENPASLAIAGLKATNLAGLRRAGVAVADGVVVTSALARYRAEHGGKWPADAGAQVRRCLGRLEKRLGARYGKGPRPLLLAVRPSPGPGLPSPMRAILCCGLNPDLADCTTDTVAFWNLYLWYVRDFACRVHGLERRVFDDMVDGRVEDPQQGRSRVEVCFKRFRKHTRRKFPTRTWDQLRQAVDAILDAGAEPLVSGGTALETGPVTDANPPVGGESTNDADLFAGCPAILICPMGPLSAQVLVHTQDPDDPLGDSARIDALPGPLIDVEDLPGDAEARTGTGGPPFVVNRDTGTGDKADGGSSTNRFDHSEPRQIAIPDFDDVVASAAVCLRSGDGGTVDFAALFSKARLQGLARQARAIEEHVGRPVAASFAVGPRHAMLFGARPAGVDPVAAQVEPTRDAIVERLTALAQRGHGPWFRCALDERLTYPTTLTWDLVRRLAGPDSGMGRLLRRVGYRAGAGSNDDGVFECIAGRLYVDVGRLGGLFARPSPAFSDPVGDPDDRSDHDSVMGTDRAEALLDFPPRWPGGVSGGRVHASSAIAHPIQWWILRRARRRLRWWVQRAARRWRDDVLPRYLDWLGEQGDRPLEAMNDRALFETLERGVAGLLDDWAGELLFPGWLAPMAFESLAGMLEQIMGAEHGLEYALTLTQALDDDMTCRLARDLVETAAGGMDLDNFMAEHGHRTAGELELANPRWGDDPRLLERLVQRLATETGRAAAQRLAEARARRGQACDDLPVHLRRWGATTFEADIVREVSVVQELLACRESAWHFFMLGYEQIRRIVEALARRSELGRHIYDLRYDELSRLLSDPSGLSDLARQRGIQRRAARRLATPARIDPDRIDEQVTVESGPLTDAGESEAEPSVGRSLNPGLASGPVYVAADPFADDVPAGRIVVCRAVDVGWIPLLLSADGLIVEQGGLMGAAGLAARALGVPAITWPQATQRLRTGDQVRVDAHDGRLVRMGG